MISSIKYRLAASSILIAGALLYVSSVRPMDIEDSLDDLFFDEPMFSAPITRAQVPPFEVVSLLDQFGLVSLLQEELFNKTYPLNRRDLLDYPLFIVPWRFDNCTYAGYQLFYNQMSNAYFSSDCNKISAYLGIGNQGFVEKLQEILEKVKSVAPDFDPEQAVDILALFQNFTVQERRLGIMFNIERRVDEWKLKFFFPFYLCERNHFVNDQLRKTLNRVLEPITGTPSLDEQQFFAEEYLINDRLGLGDFRFEFDKPVCCFPLFKARMGFFATIPTAFAVSTGIIGSNIQPPCIRPYLNLQDLLNNTDAILNVSESEASDFFIAALNNLSSMILDTNLGNYGHFGIGWVLKTRSWLCNFIKRPWAEHIKLKSRMSVELLLPAKERRYFVRTIDLNEFERRDFQNESQANSNYNFLVQTLTDRLFPMTAYAVVYPGIIFRSTSRGMYESDAFSCFVGTDMYVRTQECVTDVDCVNVCDLALEKAERPTAYQSKIIAGVAFKKQMCDKEWIFSINGDATVLSSGIGLDYMVTFNLDVNF